MRQRVRALADRAAELRARHVELTAVLTAARPTPPSPDTLAAIRERVRAAMTDGDTPTRKAVIQELVEALVVTGRDHIQPYYRLPDAATSDATQVLTMTTRVPLAGLYSNPDVGKAVARLHRQMTRRRGGRL